MKLRSRPIVLALLLMLGGVLLTLWLIRGDGSGRISPRPAPALAYTTLDGQPAQLRALRGKVVLVNFWATSCGPCVREMPRLVAAQRRYADRGFETLAVAMHYDPPARVVQFTEARALPFQVVIDIRGEAAREFGGVRLTPTTYLIDRQGSIVARYLGTPPEGILEREVERLLAAG